MTYLPIRLPPGADLRRALEHEAKASADRAAFVVAGIGSLSDVRLRFAAAEQETLMRGPFEIISLSGTLSDDGAHLHMSVANESGQVFGGHVCFGNVIRTTAEILLAPVTGWRLTRAHDPATGYKELRIERLGPAAGEDG